MKSIYLERLNVLQSYMDQKALDAILITLPKHVYYLTGFASEPHERFLGLIVIRQEEPSLLVPELDREAAAQAAGWLTIHTHLDTDNPYLLLNKLLPASIRRIGLEKKHLTVHQYEALAAALENRTYTDVDQTLLEMRKIKSHDELERIKHSIRLIEQVLEHGVKLVKPGITELDLVAELEYRMKVLGADGPAFDTMVLAGEKSARPHGQPGNRAIREGELLLFDLGVYANGYASDITRTFAVGDVSDELSTIYNAVLEANRRAIAAVRPGAPLSVLDRTARQYIEEQGFGPHFMHRLGHGLGLDVHEYPSVHDRNDDPLEEGMVLTIEPGIYWPGKGGVRIEDDITVTADGCEVLTAFPKELTIIG
ncbi:MULTISPECIES: M24 family metallopeptidase [Paenibacillus]|uniref:M24 family metallopeptidase n=1 Tax=Paenibacillus residui TaxID=629724 RepID=A0ABW3D428_9BACL|nr:Xaa-Pro peptidase family protein [Paenibacillus sp. 32O-W]